MTQGTLVAWEVRRALRGAPRELAIFAAATLLLLWVEPRPAARAESSVGILGISTSIALTPSFLAPAVVRAEPPTSLLLAGCTVPGVIWARGIAAALRALVWLVPSQIGFAMVQQRPPLASLWLFLGLALVVVQWSTLGTCVRVRLATKRGHPERWRLAMLLAANGIVGAAVLVTLWRSDVPADHPLATQAALVELASFRDGRLVLFMALAIVPTLLFAVGTTSRAAASARRGEMAWNGEERAP